MCIRGRAEKTKRSQKKGEKLITGCNVVTKVTEKGGVLGNMRDNNHICIQMRECQLLNEHAFRWLLLHHEFYIKMH